MTKMTPEQLKSVEQKITHAVEEHLATGGRLMAGTFRTGNDLCPIACLLKTAGRHDLIQGVSDQLGFRITDEQLWSFIAGFDGSSHFDATPSLLDQDMLKLGKHMRQKYHDKIDVRLHPYEEWSR